MLTDFVKRLNALKPHKDNLIKGGYSDERIEDIYANEFSLKKKKKTIKVSSLIDDFICNYNINTFSILNLYFSDSYINDNILENHIIIGSLEGGYISYECSSKKFYTCYAEDKEGTIGLLCENDTEFFEILLIVAEYSSKLEEKLITIDYSSFESREKAIEPFVEKCDNISPYGLHDRLFD